MTTKPTGRRPWMKAAEMLVCCTGAAIIVSAILKNVTILAVATLAALATLVPTVLAYAWIGYKRSTDLDGGADTPPRD